MSLRMEKVNSELQKRIMEIIQGEVDDPHLGIISVTRVETTVDLKESKVYFSLLDDTKYDKAKDILNKMGGFIRMRLGNSIRIKILPELHFIPDDSIKYSVDMYQKIEQVKADDAKRRKEHLKD
ncbi:MAG: 30S ribosome-binding factor RbfA [Candidatus Omnitrophota bacterium]